ncbi:unnamed protein product [Brachionus calyciflorus]|uniref:Uncharacterized protein n=1 Tax=Brachionus calyciflorus TaxID=104777 RepID=A0A814RVE8_9BILA|nr:unnamed protein product [Brachionus calyciflorus]
MTEYILPFLNDDIKKILSNLVVDKTNKDKFHINGKFMPVIETYVSKHEKTTVQLRKTNAVVYKACERSTTPFIRVNANCTLCSENCRYTFTIQKDPFEDKESTKEYTDALVSITNNHTHNGIVRLTGQLREETAQEIKHSFNGSSKKYQLSQIAKGLNPPSVQALRKCHSQYTQQQSVNISTNIVIQNDVNISVNEAKLNDNNQNQKTITNKYSSDFYTNIITVSETYRGCIIGNKINGYVQEVSTYPSLKLSIFTEKQFESINKTPEKNRILHFDATGSLVSIPQQYTKNLFNGGYKRILNYFMLLKNYNQSIVVDGKTKHKTAIVGEYITSQHDVLSISSFLTIFKDNYEKCYPNEILKFRLVCIDYSWASIHAVLKALNHETVIDSSIPWQYFSASIIG